jgi:hypothetical protein
MNLSYPLLCFCLLFTIQLCAQTEQPRRRPPVPSWLPQPPQRPARAENPPVKEAYQRKGFPNVLTLNVPSFSFIDHNPCISLGVEYERFITKSGSFSASLAAYWYTAYVYDKHSGDSHVAWFEGYQAMPAFLYHPLGNTRRVDISVGPCLSLGNYREEIETSNASGQRQTSVTSTPFTALLGQFNLTGHHIGSFVLAMHFSAGAIISETNFDPGVLQVGMKFGRRF